MKVKEVEELIKIVGKGNLLELAFIYLGVFQHASLDDNVEKVDDRHYNGLFAFTQKSKEPLDHYFNLRFSLQGLFFIYAKAYQILSENNELSTKDVIDKIYNIIEESKLKEDISKIVDGRELDLLNVLVHPKRKPIFEVGKDFEDKILIDVKKLLNRENTTATLNEYDKNFALNECVIDCYYFIHKDIKVDKDVVLLLSMCNDYEKLSPFNKLIKKEILRIIEDKLIYQYVENLAKILQNIQLSDEGGLIKYGINDHNVDQLEEIFSYQSNQTKCSLFPKNIKKTLEQLLKSQNSYECSNEFEKRVTGLKNTYCSVSEEEDRHVLSSDKKKKEEKHTEYKNTVCKLILGVFVVSALLCAVDYFLMKQKLLQPVKNILPQDNLTNLVIAAVLTVIIVSALFQLLKPQQEPPKQKIAEVLVTNEKSGSRCTPS